MLSKLLYLLIAGGVGGALAWLLTEPLMPREYQEINRSHFRSLLLYGSVSGACIGMMVGLASGFAQGSRQHTLRGFLSGLGVGLIGGMFGASIGQWTYAAFQVGASLAGDNFVTNVVSRTVGWALFGALVGLSEGITGRSARRLRQGALGGLVGGAIGGFAFETVGRLLGDTLLQMLDPGRTEGGVFARGIALTIMGAAIGLFIGLLEVLSRQAWIRVVMGRNEGKEYPIDRPIATIGRSELADVPLFGEGNVAPTHAQIIRQGGACLIVDAGTPAGTFVNGQRVSQAPLKDGDQINIGGFTLQFREKAGAAARRARDLQRVTPPPVTVPDGVCPYCGQRKDPITGACACAVPTVPGVAAMGSQPPGFSPSPSTGYPGQFPAPGGTPVTTVGRATAIRAIDGLFAGQVFPIPPGGLGVGREQERDLVLPDSSVSRRHARLVIEGGQLVLYDEGSTNGTFVNEQPITRQPLKPGDVIRIGTFRFLVE